MPVNIIIGLLKLVSEDTIHQLSLDHLRIIAVVAKISLASYNYYNNNNNNHLTASFPGQPR